MKILLTVHTYLPHHDGVQFVTQYLAEGLVKKGHQVTLITYARQNCPAQETINGVNVIRWDASTRYTFHRGDKKGYQNYLLEHINQYDALVNVGTQTALTDWLFPIFNKIQIPKILYLHSVWEFKLRRHDFRSFQTLAAKLWANLRWTIYYARYGAIFQQYDRVTQLHEMDESYAFFKNKYGIDSIIMENAAEDSFFTPDTVADLPLPAHYVVNVSNFIPRKNQKKCLEVFYKSNLPADCQLILIGSTATSYLQNLKKYNQQLRAQYGLKDTEKQVQFLTGVPREHIYTYVKKSSLYLMCSTWEAFPISLTEAMAAGVPFLSSDVGIVRFLSGGITARTDNEFLFWLNRLGTDEKLRAYYGNLGHHEAATHYQISGKVDALEKHLQTICSRRGAL